MLINYFRVAIRNLFRQKGYSFINIIGLTLGLATALFIFIWVYDEVTYDKFNENIDNIYRIEMDQDYNGRTFHVTVTPYPAGEGWKTAIPEITESVRLAYSGTLLCEYGEQRFYENSIIAVDSSIFSVFTFPLSKGNPELALTKPNSIVLSKEMAEKYFGNEEAMGKIISIDNQHNMEVTGVLEEIPRNSTIRFDFLVPFDFTKTMGSYSDSWTMNSIHTYVLLNPNSDPVPVDTKLTETVIDHIDWSTRSGSREEYRTKFNLAPLKRIHLHAYFGFNHTEQAYRSVLIMAIIGIFILIIASINYMNLATARSARRAREIGLRKVSGSSRQQIIRQFFIESIITAFVSILLSLILVALLMDSFELVSGKDIPVSTIFTLPFLIGLLCMGLFTGIAAGIYPALFLSGFKPVKVLYGDPTSRGGKGLLRKVLVVVQFSMSLLLIIGTTVVFSQNKFLSKFDRGFDGEDIMYIQLFGEMNESYPMIRDAMREIPEIEYVSAGMHRPGMIGSNGGGIQWDGMPEGLEPLVSQTGMDFDYEKMLGVDVVAGRAFSKNYPSDLYSDSTGSFMINETLAKVIDREDIVGMNLTFMGITGPIVGIIKDYTFTSLRTEIPPLAMVASDSRYLRFIGLRLRKGDRQAMIPKIEDKWNEVMPDYPFEYRFVSQDFEAENRANKMMGSLLLAFTLVAIIIACLGLLGLSAFLAEKRTREIGIRKTLGSSSFEITSLMVRQFSWLILISILISIPLAYWTMNGFLQDYSNRISLGWPVFTLPALMIFLIAVATVSFYAIKASKTSPSICLRYE